MKKHITLSFMLIGITISAQERSKKTYSVNVNDNELGLTARINILEQKSTLSPNEDLNYYWYAANKVQQTKGGYDGKLLHGPYSSFYLNGNLKEQGGFKKGLKSGKWHSWYAQGVSFEIVHWKRGVKHGRYVLYSEEGIPELEANYRNDKLHGTVKVYEAGKLIGTKHYRNGKEKLPKVKADKQKRDKGQWKMKIKKLLQSKKKEKSPSKKKDNEKTKKDVVTKM